MRRALWVMGVASIWLTACSVRTDEAVSLAEAKRLVAQFGRQGFVAPPRTIADVALVLERVPPDPAVVSANLAVADSPPPSDMPAHELAEFYFRRTAAAAQSGRTRQRLADARAALEHGLAANVPFNRLNAFRHALVAAESAAGHPLSAFRERLAQLHEAAPEPPGWSLATLTHLASQSSELGRLDDATQYLARAQHVLARTRRLPQQEGDDTRLIAAAEGRIALSAGRFSDAERAYRQAIAGMERFIVVYDQLDATKMGLAPKYLYEQNVHVYRSALAESLLGQGRVIEAEVEARTALAGSLGVVGKSGPTMGLLSRFSSVLVEQWRLSEAEQLIRAVIDTSLASGIDPSSRIVAAARSQLARVLGLQERFDDQMSEFSALRISLQDDPEGNDHFLYENPEYALAASRAGRHDEALTIMRSAVQRRERSLSPDHPLLAQTQGQLAIVLSNAGHRDEALALFRRVASALIRDMHLLGDARSRRAKTVAILEAYMSLLMSLPHEDGESAAEAFQIADVARGQGVMEAVNASVARMHLGSPDLANLARLEQDARQQIVGLQTVLAEVSSAPPSESDAAGIATLLQRIGRLRASHAVLLQQLESRFPAYAQLIRPKPITLTEARATLRPGEVLVAIYVAFDRTYVWAVPQAGAMRTAVVPLSARRIRDMVGELRRSLDPGVDLIGEIPAFDLALSHGLFAALLEPVHAAWRGATTMLVVSNRALAQIPFAILVTRPTSRVREGPGEALFAAYKSVPWLVREVAVSQVPSVTTLVGLRALPAPAPGRKPFLGFGDPWFNSSQATAAAGRTTPVDARATPLVRGAGGPRFRTAPGTSKMRSADLSTLPRLPDTAEEVRAIALALNANPVNDVHLGAAVSERTLGTADLPNRRIIVFATHGLVPGDLDGLSQPALALSSPEVSGDDGDGLLTMDEILGLRLNADWVVLSACNTAAGDGAGAEALSGLGRAFFYAGTRALLASNWPVETSAARALTVGMFQQQAGDPSLSGGEALRRAEMALIDGPGAVDTVSGKVLFSYAHPIFWAPFSLIGDTRVGATRSTR